MVQLDVERARWLLRAYLRTRISKVSVDCYVTGMRGSLIATTSYSPALAARITLNALLSVATHSPGSPPLAAGTRLPHKVRFIAHVSPHEQRAFLSAGIAPIAHRSVISARIPDGRPATYGSFQGIDHTTARCTQCTRLYSLLGGLRRGSHGRWRGGHTHARQCAFGRFCQSTQPRQPRKGRAHIEMNTAR